MANDESKPSDLLSQSDLGQKDRIQILLSEYSMLRTEILSRTGYGFQLSAIFVAIATWVLKEANPNSTRYFWLGVVLLCALFVWAVLINGRDLKRAAHRVKELEHEVNSRAGEHLLVWETLSGVMTRMGMIESFFSKVKSLPRSQLPPLDSGYLEGDAGRHETKRSAN